MHAAQKLSARKRRHLPVYSTLAGVNPALSETQCRQHNTSLYGIWRSLGKKKGLFRSFIHISNAQTAISIATGRDCSHCTALHTWERLVWISRTDTPNQCVAAVNSTLVLPTGFVTVAVVSQMLLICCPLPDPVFHERMMRSSSPSIKIGTRSIGWAPHHQDSRRTRSSSSTLRCRVKLLSWRSRPAATTARSQLPPFLVWCSRLFCLCSARFWYTSTRRSGA